MTPLHLPFPPPLSACFTNAPKRGRVPTKRYKDWQEEALWQIKAQKVKPVAGRVTVYVRVVSPDKRNRDLGNLDKALADVLVRAGIIEDDGRKCLRKITYEWMEEGPPCAVLIQPIEEEAAA